MKKTIKLTESDLTRIVKRILNENNELEDLLNIIKSEDSIFEHIKFHGKTEDNIPIMDFLMNVYDEKNNAKIKVRFFIKFIYHGISPKWDSDKIFTVNPQSNDEHEIIAPNNYDNIAKIINNAFVKGMDIEYAIKQLYMPHFFIANKIKDDNPEEWRKYQKIIWKKIKKDFYTFRNEIEKNI